MSAAAIDLRLRQFLLLLTALTLFGTLGELWLTEHTQEPLQLIPFVLGGAGLLAVAAALLRPQRATLIALRLVMIAVALGGLLGIGLHLANNLAFEQEIRHGAAAGDLLLATLKGANPLLAPGIMVFAGLLALVATYYHPALGDRNRL
jgi:hypothetical protein